MLLLLFVCICVTVVWWCCLGIVDVVMGSNIFWLTDSILIFLGSDIGNGVPPSYWVLGSSVPQSWWLVQAFATSATTTSAVQTSAAGASKSTSSSPTSTTSSSSSPSSSWPSCSPSWPSWWWSPVPRASLSPGETRPGDSPAARKAVHQQRDKVIVIIANRSRLRWNKSWCSQHQIFIFKTPTRPSNNPRPDNDSDNSDNDNDNNQAVQQPQHPKQLHSTCTSTCTCTCAAVQVETFATVREAVKYYLAEFFFH